MNSVKANLLIFYGNMQHNHPLSQPLLPELRLSGDLLEPLPAAFGQGTLTPWTSCQYNIYKPHWAHWILWLLITQPDSPCFLLSERFYLRQLIATREARKIERQRIFQKWHSFTLLGRFWKAVAPRMVPNTHTDCWNCRLLSSRKLPRFAYEILKQLGFF